MGHAIVAGGAWASVPVTGIRLGDIAVGQLVKINENSSPVEFYVAKHDYESALNGAGRTLLVRKDCYGARNWNSNDTSNFANTEMVSWLNSDYKLLLDSVVQEAIGTTKFYFTAGKTTSVSVLEKSVFLLSVTELGGYHQYANVEGSVLPIATRLNPGYYGGSAVGQWTRTGYNGSTTLCIIITSGGSTQQVNAYNKSYYSRPCFTLPSGALFDEETMLFNGKVVV